MSRIPTALSLVLTLSLASACTPRAAQRTGDSPAGPTSAATSTTTARAQDDAATGGEGLEFRYDHFAMLVPDLDSASAWLERVFGVREIYDGTEKDNIRWFTFGDGQTLHVIEGEAEGRNVPKRVHVALRTADVDAFIAHLDAIGVPYEDWPGVGTQVSTRPDKVRQIYVVAPGGYYFEVNDSPVVKGAGRLVGAPQ